MGTITRINGHYNTCDGCLGACCILPECASLGKPGGERCRYLTADGKCSMYESRPRACRQFDCINAPPRLKEALYLQMLKNQSLIPPSTIEIKSNTSY